MSLDSALRPPLSWADNSRTLWADINRAPVRNTRKSLRLGTCCPGSSRSRFALCTMLLVADPTRRSTFVNNDVEHRHFRSRFKIGRGIENLRDQQFLSAGAIQKRVCRIVLVALKIHLGNQPILLPGNLEMDVCWPHKVRPSRVSCRLYGCEAITSFFIRVVDRRTIKVRVEWGGIRVTRMRIAPLRIGLPHFHLCLANRLARKIQHLPDHIEDLPPGATGTTGHPRQIGGFRHFRKRIKRPEYLAGR